MVDEITVKSLRDLALAIMAGLMMLLGLWIALFAAGWIRWLPWLMFLLSTASLVILLVMRLAQRRWVRVKSANRATQYTHSPNRARPLYAEADPAIIELAVLQYELFDADEPAIFTGFLDQPLLVQTGAQPAAGFNTPGQVIENAVLAYIKQVEERHQGQITTNVRIMRGSLTISLAFLSVYGFLAQYHDFVESLAMLRQQMQGLMHQVNSWYYNENGREICVRSDVQLKSPADARQSQAATPVDYVGAGPPFGVSTTVTPAHNDIRIHVANSALVNWLTLLLGVLLLAQSLLVAFYLLCVGDNDAPICAALFEQFKQWSEYVIH